MFVHLRLHTEFSVVDSTCRIDEVVKSAANDGQPALAITDLNNLFGGVKFYKEGRGKGVKPILGAEINLEGLGGDVGATSRVNVLVQNHQGYLNMCELLARGWVTNAQRAQAWGEVARQWEGGALLLGDEFAELEAGVWRATAGAASLRQLCSGGLEEG
jgi:DNA polymerase-3 subunit alpha